MSNSEVKERILHAAQELVEEKGINAITCRDIAGRAGVGLGSINYHFKSRDDLLSQAVITRFRNAAEDYRSAGTEIADPKASLAQQMEGMLRMLLRFGDTARFVLQHRMTTRTFTAERHMLKLINQYYAGCDISPLEIKLKAMALSATISMAFFNHEEFFRYTDLNLEDTQDLSCLIKALLNAVLAKPKGDEYEEAKKQ